MNSDEQDSWALMYYLQSRYYDPQIGRFINADDVSLLGRSATVLAPKVGGFILCLMLLQSVFFWFKLKEVWLIIYQCVSYISAFLLIGAEFSLRKKASSQNKNQTES